MQNRVTDSIIVIVTFLIAFYGKRLLNILLPPALQDFTWYLWWGISAVGVLGVLFGFKEVFKNLGLNKGFLTGLIFGFVTVSPMLISSAIAGDIDKDLSIGSLIHTTLVAGFMEEFLFRGFLFGILFRRLDWGFIPASILGGLIFGMGHLYQGSTIAETIGVFLVTSAGAVWFSWLYAEWDNLWIPVFLHILMNLSWILFDVSSNALGGSYTNLFRVITIALTILITIRRHKKSGMRITKQNLLINKMSV